MKTTQLFKQTKRTMLLLLTLVGLVGMNTNVMAHTFSSVTIIKVEKKADCSEATFKVKFKVNNPGPNGGYIVQKVHLKGYRVNCDLTGAVRVDLVYYECWFVPAGQDSAIGGPPETGTTGSGATYNDQYTMKPLANTFGEMSWQGEVAYIAIPASGPNPIDSTWGPTNVPQSGGLLATTTTPSFWGAMVASGKTSSHDAYTSWYCCDGVNSAFILDNTHVPVTIEVDTNDIATIDSGDSAALAELKNRLRDFHSDSTVQELIDRINQLTQEIEDLLKQMEELIENGDGITPDQLEELNRLREELKQKQEELEQKIRESRGAPAGGDPVLGMLSITEGDFKLYPNPSVSGHAVTVEYVKGINSVRVYNALGAEVDVFNVQGEVQVTLDLIGYRSGQYLLMVEDASGNIRPHRLMVLE